MSRIEAGALKPRRQWSVLGELIASVLTRMRRATGTHRLEVEVPGDLPLVPLDYVQMEQVFTNLVSNSLKYAPVGTLVRIRAAVQDQATLCVQVINQGPPVAAEHLDRIFDKFFRVTAADRVTGTGLGLSVCRGIIEAHGGRIWAENLTAPPGFAFNFTLPLVWEGASASSVPTDSEAE
jgi:two-component system sensor histidine kinase KdpD